MKKRDSNPRRDFLKTIPLALLSAGVFSIFRTRKSEKIVEKEYNTLSKDEADEIIRNEAFPASVRIHPAPAPVEKINPEG